MSVISEYLKQSYLTLILLSGLSVILFVNRRTKIDGIQFIWLINGLIFSLTIFEYLEFWSDHNNKNVMINFVKTSSIYCIYPLISLLELCLIAPVKHKMLLISPYLAFVGIEAADMFGAGLTYSFNSDHVFSRGPLAVLPITFNFIYVLILMVYAIVFIRKGSISKALIVLFITFTVLLTAYLEYMNIVVDLIPSICAVSVIFYYFYFAAIHQSEVQAELHRRNIELEQSKLNLLIYQIKPHFINNALISVREMCYEDPEKAADLISHFALYLRHNINATDSTAPIPFMDEINAIKEYLELEYADSTKKFRVSFELQYTDFSIPALSVEPFVENAVKHGIDRYSENSEVKIISCERENDICVEVRDNGKGFDLNSETLGRGGIGISNTSSRLRLMCGGSISIDRDNDWTVITISIPKKKE